jgi:hypothetical protein
MASFKDGAVVQICFVVTDIRAAMAGLTASLGAGPWFWRERGVFPRQRLHGRPVDTELSIAMAGQGDMIYELIEKLDKGPSVYDAVIAQGGGMHHVGVVARDYPAACAARTAQGERLVYEAEVLYGARVGYFDTRATIPGMTPPPMVELIEFPAATQAMFARILEAHAGWDGSAPLRPLGPLQG